MFTFLEWEMDLTRNLYGKIMGKFHECDGIVVDTRFNRGGDLVADLNMFLSGEEFITYETEERQVGYEPTFRWTKENVVLANEANILTDLVLRADIKNKELGN